MAFYPREAHKCPICNNEEKVSADLNSIMFFEDKVQIVFKCGTCSNEWDIVFATQYMVGENLTINNGVELIAAERQRQIDIEGFTPEHDKQLTKEELAKAAICYALPPKLRRADGLFLSLWPFECKRWKPSPKGRIRELVKAAALLAAEIDRRLAFLQ